MSNRIDWLFDEIRKLASATALPKCVVCGKPPEHINQFYRCWDCKSALCEEHVLHHFGSLHQPHPILIPQIIDPLKELVDLVEKDMKDIVSNVDILNGVPPHRDDVRQGLLYRAKDILSRLEFICSRVRK